MPEALAVVLPTVATPFETTIRVFASAVPLITGVPVFAGEAGDEPVMVGIAGAAVSTTSGNTFDDVETFNAASVAVAVIA